MNTVLVATFAGLATAFFWGTSDWLAARSTKTLKPLEINFGLQTAGMIMMAVLLVFSDVHFPTKEQWLIIACGMSLVTAAYLLFVKALSSGVVGVIVPLAGSYPIVTVLLSVVILDQAFTVLQIAAMFGIVAGASLLAYEKNHKKIPLKQLHKDTALALTAALIWGVAFFVMNLVVDDLSWQAISISGEIIGLTLASLLLLFAYGKKTPAIAKKTFRHKTVQMTGFVGMLGAVTLYIGGDYSGSLVIPTVLSAGGPLVASVWGAIYEKERIGALKRAGALVIVAGIIVLNLA